MVYNELEIYRYDENSETWVGPDVLFSSPRPLGFDHTTVFDTFWGDDVTFDGENCFENLCQSIGHNCNENEKCVQSWNYYETDTHSIGNVVECCDGSDCRKIVDPIKTTESPTTFTQSTVTTSTESTVSDICECTSDVISNIGNGYVGSLSKYGQVKLYSSGPGTVTFAISHAIHAKGSEIQTSYYIIQF